jgi:hypothetical protein
MLYGLLHRDLSRSPRSGLLSSGDLELAVSGNVSHRGGTTLHRQAEVASGFALSGVEHSAAQGLEHDFRPVDHAPRLGSLLHHDGCDKATKLTTR